MQSRGLDNITNLRKLKNLAMMNTFRSFTSYKIFWIEDLSDTVHLNKILKINYFAALSQMKFTATFNSRFSTLEN